MFPFKRRNKGGCEEMRRRWKSCVVKEVIEGRRVVGAVARKNLCVAYRGGTALHCTALHCTPHAKMQ